MSDLIADKLSTVRRKHSAVGAGHGLVWVVAVVVGGLLGVMGVDYLFDLPYAARVVALAAIACGAGYLAVTRVVLPLVKAPDDETVALMIESFYADAASRIISAVQFSRAEAVAGVSQLMVGAAVREAEAYIEPKETADVVDARQLLKRLGYVAAGLAAAAGLFFLGRPNSDALLLRALCVPGVSVPRATRVELVTPRDRVVAKGDSVQLVARAIGTIPGEGTLRAAYEGGASSDFVMPAVRDEEGQFAVTIDNVQGNFTYHARLNDGRSETGTITAHARPEVAAVKLTQHFPAYTQLPPAERSKNDLTLLAGSRLQLRVTSSKPLAQSVRADGARTRVVFEGSNVTYFLTRDPSDAKAAVTLENNQPSVPVPPGTTGVTIHLVDELGLESKNAATYPIQLVPDAAPRIEIRAPQQREELVTPRAGTNISYRIDDDFGLKTVALKYMPASADTELPGDGLLGQYFANQTLSGEPVFERIDKQLNFDTRDPLANKQFLDDFSVRWTGKIIPRLTGPHVFSGFFDDGVRVFIDDQLVLDAFDGKAKADAKSDPVLMEAGKMASLRIEFREDREVAAVRFAWTRPDGRREIVPTAALFSSDEAVRAAKAKRIVTVPLPAPTGRSAEGVYAWDLSPLRLTPGQVIEWWVEAADGNTDTGPGVTESEHRTLRIGTEAEVREYLLGRLGNPLQEIQDVQERQVEEAGKLGEVFRERK